MALDKILIGTRIRELRERILEESREEFAKRCDFSDERYVGQLERGEFLPSLESLYKIADATGVNLNDLLIGKKNTSKSMMRENLLRVIKNSNTNELKVYNTCIMTLKRAFETRLDK